MSHFSGIVTNAVLGFMRKKVKDKQPKKGKVYESLFVLILGIVAFVACLIPAILTYFSDEPLWVPILLLLLSSLGASLIIAFVNSGISYDDNCFVSKNFFGIKRKYTYDQVTSIRENMHETFIYIGKRRVTINDFSIGGKEFVKLVKKKYQTTHNGQSIPQTKTKFDIFNGHIDDPGSTLFGFILGSVLAIGLMIFCVCAYFTSSTTSNTIEQSVSFVSCDVKAEEIVLTSNDNKIYKVEFIDGQFNTEKIKALCDGEKIVATYSDEVTPDDEEDYYLVKAIAYNDNYVLSFEETNRVHRQEWKEIIIFVAVLCLLWVVVVVMSVIVGRNPKKFSKRFVGLFFKDGYVRY